MKNIVIIFQGNCVAITNFLILKYIEKLEGRNLNHRQFPVHSYFFRKERVETIHSTEKSSPLEALRPALKLNSLLCKPSETS